MFKCVQTRILCRAISMNTFILIQNTTGHPTKKCCRDKPPPPPKTALKCKQTTHSYIFRLDSIRTQCILWQYSSLKCLEAKLGGRFHSSKLSAAPVLKWSGVAWASSGQRGPCVDHSDRSLFQPWPPPCSIARWPLWLYLLVNNGHLGHFVEVVVNKGCCNSKRMRSLTVLRSRNDWDTHSPAQWQLHEAIEKDKGKLEATVWYSSCESLPCWHCVLVAIFLGVFCLFFNRLRQSSRSLLPAKQKQNTLFICFGGTGNNEMILNNLNNFIIVRSSWLDVMGLILRDRVEFGSSVNAFILTKCDWPMWPWGHLVMGRYHRDHKSQHLTETGLNWPSPTLSPDEPFHTWQTWVE